MSNDNLIPSFDAVTGTSNLVPNRSGGGGGITDVINSDGRLTVTGTTTKTVNLSASQITEINGKCNNFVTVADEAAMLAVTGAQAGATVVSRTDLGGLLFQLTALPATTIGNWRQIGGVGSPPETQAIAIAGNDETHTITPPSSANVFIVYLNFANDSLILNLIIDTSSFLGIMYLVNSSTTNTTITTKVTYPNASVDYISIPPSSTHIYFVTTADQYISAQVPQYIVNLQSAQGENVPLTGITSIDGQPILAGGMYLLTSQVPDVTHGVNGIYVATSSSAILLAHALPDIAIGTTMYIIGGETNAAKILCVWQHASNNPAIATTNFDMPVVADVTARNALSVPNNSFAYVKSAANRGIYVKIAGAWQQAEQGAIIYVASASFVPTSRTGTATVGGVSTLVTGNYLLLCGETLSANNGLWSYNSSGDWEQLLTLADMLDGLTFYVRDAAATGYYWNQFYDYTAYYQKFVPSRTNYYRVGAISLTPVTASGAQTVGGVAVTTGTEVLLTTGTDVGFYIVDTSGAWTLRYTVEEMYFAGIAYQIFAGTYANQIFAVFTKSDGISYEILPTTTPLTSSDSSITVSGSDAIVTAPNIDVIYVAENGNDAHTGLTLQQAKETMQAGFDATPDGGQLQIYPTGISAYVGGLTVNAAHTGTEILGIGDNVSTNDDLTITGTNNVSAVSFTGIYWNDLNANCNANNVGSLYFRDGAFNNIKLECGGTSTTGFSGDITFDGVKIIGDISSLVTGFAKQTTPIKVYLNNCIWENGGAGKSINLNGDKITFILNNCSGVPTTINYANGATIANFINTLGDFVVSDIVTFPYLGAGVASFLATPSSANLAAAVTDETGNGSLVFSDSPSLVTPFLGTAAATTVRLSYTTTVTSNGTKILSVNSHYYQYFTGSLAHTVQMPDVTTLTAGQEWTIVNNSTGAITVNTSASTFIGSVAPSATKIIRCILTSGTTAASWSYNTLQLVQPSTNAILSIAASSFFRTLGSFVTTLTSTGDTAVTLPTSGTLATVAYVDSVAQGLDVKDSVVVATSANITLSGEQTIDGVLTSASRVLVKSQTLSQNNGIYLSAAGAWTRTIDANTWASLVGAFVFVEKGTTFGDTGWVCTVDAGGTLGTTPVVFTQFSGAGTYTAGNGLTLTGTVFSINTAITADLTSAQVFSNKSFISPVLGTPASGNLSNCNSLPVSSGISGLAAGIAAFLTTPTSANLATAITDETGSGALVFATSPTLITPNLGVASATSINKLFITAPANNAMLTISDAKTLTVNNSVTFSGTDGATVNFGGGGGVVYAFSTVMLENKLIALDSTTFTNASDQSKQMTFSMAAISGTAKVFSFPNYSATLATIAGTETFSNKTFVAPVLGDATGTSLALGGAALANRALTINSTQAIPMQIQGTQTVPAAGQFGIVITNVFAPTSNPLESVTYSAISTFAPPTGITLSLGASFVADMVLNGAGTVTNLYGMLIKSGVNTAGTCTNGYGIRVIAPAIGTNKYTAWLDSGVGIGAANAVSTGIAFAVTGGASGYATQITGGNGGGLFVTGGNGISATVATLYSPLTDGAWQPILLVSNASGAALTVTGGRDVSMSNLVGIGGAVGAGTQCTITAATGNNGLVINGSGTNNSTCLYAGGYGSAIGFAGIFRQASDGNNIIFTFRNAANVEQGNIGSTGGTSVQFNTTSDYRLKENIVDATDSLEALKTLRIRKFNYKGQKDTLYGVLAHEVQDSPYLGNLINGKKDAVDDEGKMIIQTTDKGGYVCVAIGAILELADRMAALEKRAGLN